MEKRTHLSIRMDAELHDKLQCVAAYEGRSMSNYMLFLMQKAVREFEQEHGPIVLPEQEGK